MTQTVTAKLHRLTTPAGVNVSYARYGSGPPLVLVHGGFSDHDSNWELIKPLIAEQFTVHAIARRGRGETDATETHSLIDEAEDVAAVIRSVGEPVFLLGHAVGALIAAEAARTAPALVRKLVLYEPPKPTLLSGTVFQQLSALADQGDWENYSWVFFKEGLGIPIEEMEELRASEVWAAYVADARATAQDMRALREYELDPQRFQDLNIPTLFQVGSESPAELFLTDELAPVFPNARVETLAGQAHEGMTTAPEQYVAAITKFLLG